MKSLQSKIFSAMVVVALLPFIMMLYVHHSIATEYKKEISAGFLDTAHLINDEIQHYSLDTVHELHNFTDDMPDESHTHTQDTVHDQHTVEVDTTTAQHKHEPAQNLTTMIRHVSRIMQKQHDYRYLFVLDDQYKPAAALARAQDGHLIALDLTASQHAARLLSVRSTIKQLQLNDSDGIHAGTAVRDEFADFETTDKLLPLYMAVQDQHNASMAHVLAYISLQTIDSIITDSLEAFVSRGADDVGVALIDLNGSIISNMNAFSRGHSVTAIDSLTGINTVLAAVKHDLNTDPAAGVSGWMIQNAQDHSHQFLLNYFLDSIESGDHQLRWIVVITQPLALAYSVVEEQKVKLTIVALINILLLVTIGLWFGSGVSLPLKSLVSTMQHYQQGILDAEIDGVTRKDEVGDLARTFESFREYQQQHERLIDEHMDQYRQLMAAQKQADDLLMGAAEAIIMVDEQGIIRKANTVSYALFGYDEAELIGNPVEILIPARYVNHVSLRETYAQNPVHRQMAESRELLAVKKDASEFHINVALAPTQTIDGLRFVATIKDMTQELLYQDELRKLSTVALNTSNMIAICDKHGIIEWVNTTFEEVCGHKLAHVTGKSLVQILFDESTDQASIDKLENAMTAEHSIRLEKHNRSWKGIPYCLDIDIKPVLAEHGLEHFVMIATDITAYMEIQKQLIQVNDSLEEKVAERTRELSVALDKADILAKSKASFLATMSHEIRTPINGVMGMTELLKKTALNDDQHRLLDTVVTSSIQLRTIIDDILDFSKIEAGKLELRPAVVSIRTLVFEVGELLSSIALDKSIHFVIGADAGIPDIMADAVRIRQILFNLVGNALKFTPPGGIVSLYVEMKSLADGLVNLDFQVKDNGLGIAVKDQRNLFQPFSQVDGTTTRQFGGTGLGLSIVTLLVEMMDGTMMLDSELDKGSLFTVQLTLPAVENSAQHYDLSHTHVLLMELPGFISAKLRKLCEQAGARVSSPDQSADLDELISHIPGSETRHIVVLARPDQDRLESIVPSLSALTGRYANVSIILLLAEKYQSKALSITGMTLNPLNLNELLDRIRGLDDSPVPADNRVEEQPAVEADSPVTAIDDHARILVAEDNPINQELFKLQLELLGYKSIIVNDGEEALEQWKNGQYAMILTDCHMPKMDGFQLANEIRTLEQGGSRRTPIIAVSADVLMDRENMDQDFCFDDYITKPLNLDILSSVIAKWMG